MSDDIEVGDRTIRITRGDNILFPESGITKRALIQYYLQIADAILPYLRDRPLTMLRFPDGIEGQRFFQKDAPHYFPEWIPRVRVEKAGGSVSHVVCNDAATLVYIANQACITPHIWTSRSDRLYYPDLVVFDLDPPDGRFADVRLAAKLLRERLKGLGLVPFVQTTGSKGLHVVAPIIRDNEFDEVREWVGAVAEMLAEEEPDRLTTEFRKDKRGGRVFIDTGRNAYAQTFVSPYGVRPLPQAPVAAPIEWGEVDSIEPQSYNIGTILDRLKGKGDPWKSIWKKARPLQAVPQRGEESDQPRRNPH
jgi:bifunctional non-homologous end joining protein LigD